MPMTVSEFARQLGVSRQNLQQTLARLNIRGEYRRFPGGSTGRYLTAEDMAAVRKHASKPRRKEATE